MNRIETKFKELKSKNKKAFIVFITAGYPNLGITERLVLEFSRIGVDIVELGIPFSDPIADGPLIQEASQVALKNKTNLNGILNLIKRLRGKTEIPIALMTYYNPIFCFGEKRFARKAKASGVDGVIIPDLPPEEGISFIKLANSLDLNTILFLAPTSNLKRIKLVGRLAKGFIYYVSLTGVTGLRRNLSKDLFANLNKIKRHIAKPVCVGFGVSSPRQVKEIYRIADGVIVGSAVIKNIKQNLKMTDLVKRVVAFVQKLKDVQ